MRLIFATNNKHKLEEIKGILKDKFEDSIFSINDFNIKLDPDENGKSFEENSIIKSQALYKTLDSKNLLKSGDFVISDDTGLCIDFLNGEPGIYSARFMGKDVSQEEKNNHILELMKDVPDEKRTAFFKTCLAVIEFDKKNIDCPIIFEAKVDGYIVKRIENNGGFGYDPIFAVGDTCDLNEGQVNTYASMGMDNKNKLSHRARALSKLVLYLEKNHNI